MSRLGQQTLIYGVGHVLARFVNFLLLPLYTHRLRPEEYGIVTLIFVLIAFANILFLHGMDSAMLRFYGMEKQAGAKRSLFSTSWIWLVLTTCVLSLIWLGFSGTVARLTVGTDFQSLIVLAAGILFFDTLATNPKILLRLQNRPLTFVGIELLNVMILIGLNIWWIGIQHRGIAFIFYSNLIASATVFIVLLLLSVRELEFHIDRHHLRAQLLFGLPYIPAGVASMVTELSDRYMLKWLVDENAVGIYTAGYKLGIFLLLVVMAFKLAWQPYFLEKGDDPQAPETFARVGTYFLAVMAFMFLAVSFFIDPLVRLPIGGVTLFGADYWSGTVIVPVILLAYIFLGIFLLQLPGIYIRKKSKWIPVLNGSAAVVNITLNLVLIRRYGWQGAAWATLVSYAFLAVLQYFVVRRFYPLEWEWRQILKITGITAGLYAGHLSVSDSILSNTLLLLMYPVAMVVLRLVRPAELRTLVKKFKP